jgi:hypothetical protein
VQLKVVGGVIAGAAVVAAGAVIAQADGKKPGSAAQEGGLAVQNGLIERPAAAGANNVVNIKNNTKAALTVAVTPRPWVQSSTGTVSPNRRSTLRDVGISEHEFTLTSGASKDITVTLKTGNPQYGALEIVGLPTNVAKRKGLITGYRLVSALRYLPATKTYKLKVGSAKVKKDMLMLRVSNSGNTAEPVSGSVRLKGPPGTRRGSVKATGVLPGKTIALDVVSTKRLTAGRYTATVSLKQGSFTTKVTRRVTLKRR